MKIARVRFSMYHKSTIICKLQDMYYILLVIHYCSSGNIYTDVVLFVKMYKLSSMQTYMCIIYDLSSSRAQLKYLCKVVDREKCEKSMVIL